MHALRISFVINAEVPLTTKHKLVKALKIQMCYCEVKPTSNINLRTKPTSKSYFPFQFLFCAYNYNIICF